MPSGVRRRSVHSDDVAGGTHHMRGRLRRRCSVSAVKAMVGSGQLVVREKVVEVAWD
jgi:hypothetical protein